MNNNLSKLIIRTTCVKLHLKYHLRTLSTFKKVFSSSMLLVCYVLSCSPVGQ